MKSFAERERGCETTFLTNVPFWHLFTPGEQSWLILKDADDMKFAVTLLARCACEFSDILILTFALMNNHIHIVASGPVSSLIPFFDAFRRRLIRNLSSQGRALLPGSLKETIIPIPDIRALRNTIVYVNRNGFVADPSQTPFSYRWSAGSCFFNVRLTGRKYSEFKDKEKRVLCKSRAVAFPDSYEVIDGYIHPASFCRVDIAMSFFRDAHHYLFLLLKNVETYQEMAKELHDSVFLTDEEAYAQAARISREEFNVRSIKDLSKVQKINLASTMHYKFNSSNEQIRRILMLSEPEVTRLFPLSGEKRTETPR